MEIFFTYFYLFLAVFFGTVSNYFAKISNGFTIIYSTIFSAIAIIFCMFFLSQVMKNLSAGITYATFAGLCILATVSFDIIKFSQLPNKFSFLGLSLIICGVALVNTLGKN